MILSCFFNNDKNVLNFRIIEKIVFVLLRNSFLFDIVVKFVYLYK